jgi:hypothetical protein
MTTYSVAFHGLPKPAEASARSMLTLLLPMLGHRWRLGEATTSDVVILEDGTLGELTRTGAARPGALYVVFEGSNPPPANAFCMVRRPLTSSRLIEVLNKAQAELERSAGGMGETTNVASRFGRDSTEVNGIHASMRSAIRWALQDQSHASTVMGGTQERILSVLPGKGFSTRLSAPQIADLIRSNGQVILLVLNSEEQAELSVKLRKFEPLAKLEWIYWLTGSDGELRPELYVTKPYRLQRWPDFSRLPHYRADVHMASLLKAEAMTIGELAKRANVRLETACNFVNACWSVGVLEAIGVRAQATRPVPAEAQPSTAGDEEMAIPGGLLGSLRSALGVTGASLRSALGLGGTRLRGG